MPSGISLQIMLQIVDAMQKKQYAERIEIIREGNTRVTRLDQTRLDYHTNTPGTEGKQMYVLDQGAVTVTKGNGQDKQFVCDLASGQLFGELAILYNCRRTGD